MLGSTSLRGSPPTEQPLPERRPARRTSISHLKLHFSKVVCATPSLSRNRKSTMNTAELLESMTDAGQFELLATAVLREALPYCISLVHTGVNASGKTISAPLDGICFVPGAEPPHVVVVHHTTTDRRHLRDKWLANPAHATSRSNPQAAGDLVTAAEFVAKEKRANPELRATLILTTNREPGSRLLADVHSEANRRGLELDIWHRSRLCHFLDHRPSGHSIRRSYLGVKQELLTTDLLHELSQRSLREHPPPSDVRTWIPRSLDATLQAIPNGVTFLVASSGLGKSVACRKALQDHIHRGGCGLVVPHENLVAAPTLDQALRTTLAQLQPNLVVQGAVDSYVSTPQPLLLVVEDVNRSGQAQLLAAKLARWGSATTPEGEANVASFSWRLLCPLWPTAIASMDSTIKEQIKALVLPVSGFTEDEAREAVLAKGRFQGKKLSSLEATEIARALGFDPLLIALYTFAELPDPDQVIARYIENNLAAVASAGVDYVASDYRAALHALALGMLERRQLSPRWSEIREWSRVERSVLTLLAHMVHAGEPIRLDGTSTESSVAFRHDRVRDCLLADAVVEASRQGPLDDTLLTEPYFAEVMGLALIRGGIEAGLLQRLTDKNPLALFHALRFAGADTGDLASLLLDAIRGWLDRPTGRSRTHRHLRSEALAALAEAHRPEIPALVGAFPEPSTHGQLARLRNGDTSGGMELCSIMEPGVTAPWRDSQLDHAKLHHATGLTRDIARALETANLTAAAKRGALRLAGHLAAPALAPSIAKCWARDEDPTANLQDYLWASAQCCGEEAARYLRPVCDAWAQVSDESSGGMPSPRVALAADHLRWAFRRWPPSGAIDYFVARATDKALAWPILCMLNGIDHPSAVDFVARECARIRRLNGPEAAEPPFIFFCVLEWGRSAQGRERSMSANSRQVLYDLWCDEAEDRHVREMAFRLWAATTTPDDVRALRRAPRHDDLASHVLAARLARGDKDAIPRLLPNLAKDDRGYWWQFVGSVWSPPLVQALDKSLDRRRTLVSDGWGQTCGTDWILPNILVDNLSTSEAERLLLAHWSHLRFANRYILAALYLATPPLLKAVGSALSECPEPRMLLEHLADQFGVPGRDRGALVREEQLLAVVPYLSLLSQRSIQTLWNACNHHGWYGLRRQHLDPLVAEPFPVGWWNRTGLESTLDDATTLGHGLVLDSQISAAIAAGVSWSEILTTMLGWLSSQVSVESLEVVAEAIAKRGCRADVDALADSVALIEDGTAEAIVGDARFAVCRRTLLDQVDY